LRLIFDFMDEKLKNILERSSQLFLKFGIRNISMDEIARDLGISKKTLYAYVDNKADLLDKIFDYSDLQDAQKYWDRLSKSQNAIDQLLEVSKIVNENFKNLKPSVSFELKKFYPAIFEKFMTRKREHIFEKIFINMEQGIKEGLYREDLNKEVITKLYVQKLESVHSSEYITEAEFTFEKIFEVMFENHIRGISNEKGINYFEKQKAKLNFKS
jgi:AcrR family transcriptional regulator